MTEWKMKYPTDLGKIMWAVSARDVEDDDKDFQSFTAKDITAATTNINKLPMV